MLHCSKQVAEAVVGERGGLRGEGGQKKCPVQLLFLSFLNKSVHSSLIHNRQKLEITQKSIYRRMDKQNVIYLSDEILLSNKKKWSADIQQHG